VGVAFVDKDYPSRAAFSVVDKVLDEYSDHSRNAWRGAAEDSADALAVLEPAIVNYQAREGSKLLDTFRLGAAPSLAHWGSGLSPCWLHVWCGALTLCLCRLKTRDRTSACSASWMRFRDRQRAWRGAQDPAQADKLTRIQRDLDETKVVLHKTIESMLERGEKLEALVDKSSDLSMASQMFYKQARKTNSCCKLM